MARTAVLFSLLALCLMVPASAQTAAELLGNPALKPFITPFIGTPECLADITGSASSSFNISTCPGLLSMLEALAAGETDPTVSCELSCVKQFALLSDTCMNKLMDKFNDDSDVGRLALEFFEECDAAVRGETAGPAPAPAPAPMPAAADEDEPAAAPASEASVEAPPSWYTPTPASAAASVLPAALLSMLSVAAAAFIVLA